MNQNARTFVLIGLVVSILLAMHLLPPLFVGDTELRHVNVLSDVIPEVNQDNEDIDVIPKPEPPKVAANGKGAVSDTASTAGEASQEGGQQPADVEEYRPDGVTMIADYSQGSPGGMEHFYHQLLSPPQGRPIRVAYFGDSFIEGDILTCDLREQLQTRFGGNGVGWVDITDKIGAFRQTVQRTAKGIKEYEVVAKPFNAQFQGIAQRYFTAEEGARVSVKGSKSRKHLTTWQRCILYLRTESGIDVATTLNGDTTLREHLSGSPSVQMLVCEEDTIKSLEQRYSAITPATHLFGVAMEPRRGIVVDNFSLRGSAGFTIGQVPLHTLQDFSRLRPYDLMVFHFGLNVANAKSGAASYQAYIKHMQKAIDHVRQAYPQTSVLVVSMPDRDQRTAEGIKTMKGVESLVAYQQILASDCHVAYFNLFEAMGGRESMKALVDQGLANKDYTHLSFGGGRKIAKYLFDSLMAGFENYKRRH